MIEDDVLNGFISGDILLNQNMIVAGEVLQLAIIIYERQIREGKAGGEQFKIVVAKMYLATVYFRLKYFGRATTMFEKAQRGLYLLGPGDLYEFAHKSGKIEMTSMVSYRLGCSAMEMGLQMGNSDGAKGAFNKAVDAFKHCLRIVRRRINKIEGRPAKVAKLVKMRRMELRAETRLGKIAEARDGFL